MRRLAAPAAVAGAILIALILMFRGSSYEVTLDLANASQLVKGNHVKVGGVPVGKVKSIELSEDGQARITLAISDDGLAPLHLGTKAIVRSTSLAGIANRYVSLQPGPNNARPIQDGGQIPAEDGQPEVDLDAVLNTLGPEAQKDLHDFVQAASGLVTPEAERDMNEGLEALNPFMSQASETAREIVRDEPALERFIVQSAQVVSTVASRRDDLDQAVDNAAGALGALADRSEDLDTTLVELPDTLRTANTTLVNVRAAIADLRPALREARPAAPLLSELLERLSPLAQKAVPLVARTRRAVDTPGSSTDLLAIVEGFPSVAKEAVPAFESTTQLGKDALPVVRTIRPYTPDLLGGLFNGFGGTTAGYYDANGHYARVSFQGSGFSLNNSGTLVPPPPEHNGLAGYRTGLTHRCPGGAAQPAPDKSNPFKPLVDFPCKVEDG